MDNVDITNNIVQENDPAKAVDQSDSKDSTKYKNSHYKRKEVKENKAMIFLVGILFGIIFNVFGLVFMFMSKKNNLQSGYFIGALYFLFFLLLILFTVWLYGFTQIGE